jgi:tagatose-1,6-bisphosphate aldolase non-catalytic subunit AgaZ/GatZ
MQRIGSHAAFETHRTDYAHSAALHLTVVNHFRVGDVKPGNPFCGSTALPRR